MGDNGFYRSNLPTSAAYPSFPSGINIRPEFPAYISHGLVREGLENSVGFGYQERLNSRTPVFNSWRVSRQSSSDLDTFTWRKEMAITPPTEENEKRSISDSWDDRRLEHEGEGGYSSSSRTRVDASTIRALSKDGINMEKQVRQSELTRNDPNEHTSTNYQNDVENLDEQKNNPEAELYGADEEIKETDESSYKRNQNEGIKEASGSGISVLKNMPFEDVHMFKRKKADGTPLYPVSASGVYSPHSRGNSGSNAPRFKSKLYDTPSWVQQYEASISKFKTEMVGMGDVPVKESLPPSRMGSRSKPRKSDTEWYKEHFAKSPAVDVDPSQFIEELSDVDEKETWREILEIVGDIPRQAKASAAAPGPPPAKRALLSQPPHIDKPLPPSALEPNPDGRYGFFRKEMPSLKPQILTRRYMDSISPPATLPPVDRTGLLDKPGRALLTRPDVGDLHGRRGPALLDRSGPIRGGHPDAEFRDDLFVRDERRGLLDSRRPLIQDSYDRRPPVRNGPVFDAPSPPMHPYDRRGSGSFDPRIETDPRYFGVADSYDRRGPEYHREAPYARGPLREDYDPRSRMSPVGPGPDRYYREHPREFVSESRGPIAVPRNGPVDGYYDDRRGPSSYDNRRPDPRDYDRGYQMSSAPRYTGGPGPGWEKR